MRQEHETWDKVTVQDVAIIDERFQGATLRQWPTYTPVFAWSSRTYDWLAWLLKRDYRVLSCSVVTVGFWWWAKEVRVWTLGKDVEAIKREHGYERLTPAIETGEDGQPTDMNQK